MNMNSDACFSFAHSQKHLLQLNLAQPELVGGVAEPTRQKIVALRLEKLVLHLHACDLFELLALWRLRPVAGEVVHRMRRGIERWRHNVAKILARGNEQNMCALRDHP